MSLKLSLDQVRERHAETAQELTDRHFLEAQALSASQMLLWGADGSRAVRQVRCPPVVLEELSTAN